jgi:septum formation protein
VAQKIILASGSPHRRALLENAGLQFSVEKPKINERAVEAALAGSGATPEDVAAILGEAKATAVSELHVDALVIGSDQTLSLGDELFHKPTDMEAARRQLLKLSGKTHQLSSAVVIAKRGEVVWRHVAVAHMTMRRLDPAYVGRYLSKVGGAALSSVGCYQVEGEGIRLFENIEGEFYTIVGLPLLPLLAELRERGAIDG